MLSASHFIERETPQNKTLAQQPRGLAVEEPRKCNSTSNKKDHSISSYVYIIYHQSSRWRQIYHPYHVFAQHLIPPHFPHLKPNCFFSSLGRERHTHMTTGPGCIIDHTITNCMSIHLKNVCFFAYLTKFPTHIFFTFYTTYCNKFDQLHVCLGSAFLLKLKTFY